MNIEIEIEHLSKSYGNKQVLRDINLNLKCGMFGLLGRNGAGKTTLMRILATLSNKTDGKVNICGIPIEHAGSVRRLVGYLPQDFNIYPNMRVGEAMDYLGILSGLSSRVRKQRIPELLKAVNLSRSKNIRVRALSGGMRRRLGIAQALLHDPKVLIIDEPTAGLDPEERVRFRNLLCDLAEERIVLLSTHIVEDVEKTCNLVGILDQGKLLYNGSLTQFVGKNQSLEEAYLKRMGGEID